MNNNIKSEVGNKLWNTISNFGVSSVRDDVMSIKLIEAMELKDKKGLEGRNMVKNVLP